MELNQGEEFKVHRSSCHKLPSLETENYFYLFYILQCKDKYFVN